MDFDFAPWWTGLTRAQQDAAVLALVFVVVLLATRWGMYDADRRSLATGGRLAAPRWARTLFLWGIPTAITLFLWGASGK